jgi:hypothetical protein
MSENSPQEPTLTITLTVQAWQVIIWHLRQGVYDNVAAALTNIGLQAAQQMEDAQLAERLREEREAIATIKTIQDPLKDERSVH